MLLLKQGGNSSKNACRIKYNCSYSANSFFITIPWGFLGARELELSLAL